MMAVKLAAWAGLIGFALSLLLMVRLPGLAKAFGGLDRQYRAHHLLGLLTYLAILLHVLAVAMPGLTQGHWALAIDLWFSGPMAMSGWAALAALALPLFITFCLPLIRFDRWLLWHRTMALAFALAIIHTLTTPLGSAKLWAVAALGAAGFMALLMRAWVCRRQAGSVYVVSRVTHPARRVADVELQAMGTPIPATGGAYLYVNFYTDTQAGSNAFQGCGHYHPFSVSARDGNRLRLSIKALGDCTERMQHITPGVRARIQGPFGTLFHRAQPSAEKQLWIAGGIGIAPFLAQLKQLANNADIYLLDLYQEDADALHRDEIQEAQTRLTGLKVRCAATGPTGTTTLCAWLDDIPDLAQRIAYLCGPPRFIDMAQAQLHARGLPRRAIHAERFDFREG